MAIQSNKTSNAPKTINYACIIDKNKPTPYFPNAANTQVIKNNDEMTSWLLRIIQLLQDDNNVVLNQTKKGLVKQMLIKFGDDADFTSTMIALSPRLKQCMEIFPHSYLAIHNCLVDGVPILELMFSTTSPDLDPYQGIKAMLSTYKGVDAMD
jgi:hypothetical protein